MGRLDGEKIPGTITDIGNLRIPKAVPWAAQMAAAIKSIAAMSNAESPQPEGQSAEIKELEAAIRNGVASRTAAYQRFMKSATGGKSPEFKGMNEQQKKAFRLLL